METGSYWDQGTYISTYLGANIHRTKNIEVKLAIGNNMKLRFGKLHIQVGTHWHIFFTISLSDCPKLASGSLVLFGCGTKSSLACTSTCCFGTGWLETKALITWHTVDIST